MAGACPPTPAVASLRYDGRSHHSSSLWLAPPWRWQEAVRKSMLLIPRYIPALVVRFCQGLPAVPALPSWLCGAKACFGPKPTQGSAPGVCTFGFTLGPQLITTLSKGSPSHRQHRIEQACESREGRIENKDLSCDSQARGYGEAGGEGLFSSSKSIPHPPLRGPPSPASGRGLWSTDISRSDQNVQTREADPKGRPYVPTLGAISANSLDPVPWRWEETAQQWISLIQFDIPALLVHFWPRTTDPGPSTFLRDVVRTGHRQHSNSSLSLA